MTDATNTDDLSHIQGALTGACCSRSTHELEQITGRDHSTHARWGDDMVRWRPAAMLRLAKSDHMLAKSIVDYLGGSIGYSLDTAEAQMMSAIASCGAAIAEMAESMADGKLSPLEKQRNIARLAELVPELTRLHSSLARG